MSNVSFRRIQPLQAQDLLAHPDIRIIDVRDKKSFEQGRIGEAQHADMSKVERMLFSVDKDKPVLIYCYHGNSSQTYAQMFADFGFREVYSLDGGYKEWQQLAVLENLNVMQISTGLTAWLIEQGFPQHGINSAAISSAPKRAACISGVVWLAMAELMPCCGKPCSISHALNPGLSCITAVYTVALICCHP